MYPIGVKVIGISLRYVNLILLAFRLCKSIDCMITRASEVTYLGHIVGKAVLKVNPKKIKAMQDWPLPKTLKILHFFLGLTGYYCKFVNNYGKIATPLTALFKTNSFTWTPTTDHSFQALKVVMCTTLVLTLPNFKKTFVLECDAYRRGIGAVLMQDGRPMAFTNKQLS
jgi:hypothetical protein